MRSDEPTTPGDDAEDAPGRILARARPYGLVLLVGLAVAEAGSLTKLVPSPLRQWDDSFTLFTIYALAGPFVIHVGARRSRREIVTTIALGLAPAVGLRPGMRQEVVPGLCLGARSTSRRTPGEETRWERIGRRLWAARVSGPCHLRTC